MVRLFNDEFRVADATPELDSNLGDSNWARKIPTVQSTFRRQCLKLFPSMMTSCKGMALAVVCLTMVSGNQKCIASFRRITVGRYGNNSARGRLPAHSPHHPV